MLSLLTLSVLAVALANHASAQTSLYVPGFDPQPITANDIGVGADGSTTWLIAPGVPSGTLQDSGFEGVATMIQGPNGAEIIYDDTVDGFSVDEKCTYNSDGTAVCVDEIVSEAFTSFATDTETVSSFAIQGGGATSIVAAQGGSVPSAPISTPSAGSPPASGASQTSTPSGPLQTSSGASQTPGGSSAPSGASSSSSGTPAPTTTTNGEIKFGYSNVAMWLAGTGLAMVLFA